MKKNLIKMFALMGLMACGSAIAAEGDIWDIQPCDRYGIALSAPMSSADNPITAGSNVYFRVRLVSRTDDSGQWHIKNKIGSSTEDSLNPLRIGIYVSGRLEYADYIGELESGSHFTDVVFKYTVKHGDFALPIKLATSTGPADDVYHEDLSYVFDPLTVWRWEFTDKNSNKCNWWFFQGEPMSRGEPEPALSTDFSLKDAGFYLKTIDFDNDWENAGGIWRSVHEGSTTTVGPTPSLVALEAPKEAVTLYVWSTNESAVVVKSDRTVLMRTGGTNGSPVSNLFHVAAVKFQANQKVEFEIEGADGGEGKWSDLVLSANDHFTYSAATGTREIDYVTVPVKCVEALPPSIIIKPAKTEVVAAQGTGYLNYVTELSVKFSQTYASDVTFTVTPSFEDGAAPGTTWTDYVRVAGEKSVSSITAATNVTFTIPAGSLVPMENGAEKKIYLFALRSDQYVDRAGHHLQFVAQTENVGAHAAIGGWDTPQGAMLITAENPVITLPAEGDTSMTAVKGTPRQLRLKVADTYADTVSTNKGYKIWIQRNTDTDSSFTELEGEYAPGTGGYLYKLDPATQTVTTELPLVTYSVIGENKSIIKVQSPVGDWVRESEERNIKVTVSAPAGYTVDTVDSTYNFIEDDGEHGGGDVQIVVKLTQPNMTGGSLYAFLEPVTEASSNAVDCAFLTADGNMGLEIGDGGDSVTGFFMMIDGCTTAAESQFRYRVILRDAPVWEDGNTVTSFLCNNTLVLKSQNVVPTTTGAMMGLNETDENGEFPGVEVPMGVEQSFAAIIDEPGLADLRATGDKAFQVQWKFQTTGISAQKPVNSDTQGVIRGDPNDEANFAKFTFVKAGRWTVTINAKDKDMTGFKKEKAYTFYVDVVDQPTMSVVGWYGNGDMGGSRAQFNETESLDATEEAYNAALKVRLSFNKCGFAMKVRLTVKPPAGENPGKMELATGGVVSKVSDGVYDITFNAGVTEVEIPIQTLDGTALSRSSGFTFSVQNITEAGHVDPDSGREVSEYYIPDPQNKAIKVLNVAPVVKEEWLFPAPGSTNNCAIGLGETITWDFSDVKPDIVKGIDIVVKAPNGTTLHVTDPNQTSGSFTPQFFSSGVQTVSLTWKDADGGSVSYLWYYNVAVSKTLTMLPHGPTGGKGTPLSKHYANAGGSGRVWAAADAGAKGFEHSVNCGLDKQWTVYGYGYKVGDVEGSTFHFPDGRTGYYDNRNYAIDVDGNSDTASPKYAYGDNELDSFLYAWIQVIRAEDGTLSDKLLNGTIVPERSEQKDVGTLVGLPNEKDEEGSYDVTSVEAIFSKELYPADNMGDVNSDGIPDLYFAQYNFSGSEGGEGGEGGEGEGALDDKTSLAKFNDDEDFLPGVQGGVYGLVTADLPPFTASLEIRGYGPQLNDAPAEWLPNNDGTRTPNLCKITGVKPDKVYSNPLLDDKSTLDYVEWLAWEEFATAKGWNPSSSENWDKWSPERPTDPTNEDTDGDGFTDGFEYWYWYHAHVGYLDANGNHRYLVGRRFSISNPGEGEVIPSDEIARIFDPLSASSGGDVDTRDTDNDGLPDKLEFLIGTNPVDFDTDGDGLPDGWEICVAGTDPLSTVSKADFTSDATRNSDGDAMAFTTLAQEDPSAGVVLPKNLNVPKFSSFALIDPMGDTDGVQWYVVRGAVADEGVTVETKSEPASKLLIGGEKYLVLGNAKVVTDPILGKRLAADYEKGVAFTMTDDATVGGVACTCLRLMPVRLAAGTRVDADPEGVSEYQVASLTTGFAEKEANAAWVYGKKVHLKDGAADSAGSDAYGMLTVGRYKAAPAGVPLAAVPKDDASIAFIHYMVYQEFGFDPRTAWSAKTPLNARWGQKGSEGETMSGMYSKSKGYAGVATRTRAYANYDEFLVASFFYNNGFPAGYTARSVNDSAESPMIWYWRSYTTNPRGPGDDNVVTAGADAAAKAGTSTTGWDQNGADTDKDGVPDGWELYVMTGPKVDGKYVFGDAYENPPYSNFSPFNALADSRDKTDNKSSSAGDGDTLNERQEFAGTDTILAYAELSETITLPESHAKWINKFFPTDPWGSDTDGDGITDANEIKSVVYYTDSSPLFGFYCGNFIYGDPKDDGSTSIPGGGLNPCSVDTDADGLPDPWEAQYAGTFDEENGIQDKFHGIVNGMDGTVSDAYTRPWNGLRKNSITTDDGNPDAVNRDYDRDGLENWQEYLTGTMRCWRYDDPVSRWDFTRTEDYFDWDAETGKWMFNLDKAVAFTGCADADEFWGKTLLDPTSDIYNPYLVMDQSPANASYFSRVKNGFDPVYTDEGTYYFYFDGVDHELTTKAYDNLWAQRNGATLENGMAPAPGCYMGTSPILADSDRDGMDDYYELFHGLNPLLGESGVRDFNNQPCDLVYNAWFLGLDEKTGKQISSPVKAWRTSPSESLDNANYWTKSGSPLRAKARGSEMDFVAFPWLNGMGSADPDGDDIRNEEEALQTKEAHIYGHHLDPSPLWMTDSSYSNSLVRQFFRLPTRFPTVELGPILDASFEYQAPGTLAPSTYYLKDFAGYMPPVDLGLVVLPAYFASFRPDAWLVTADAKYNWAFSFEENEGFDTDHDGVNDKQELEGKLNGVTDAQNFDSPLRRQAMYFPGDKSVLQTLPTEVERHPMGGTDYEGEQTFRNYTVECWVYPESLANAVIVERPVWSRESKAGDEEYVRKNFQIAVRDGQWYTKFDTTGTLKPSMIEVKSGVPVTVAAWTHLAATYDGSALKFYINGVEYSNSLGDAGKGLWPENGYNAVTRSTTNDVVYAYDEFGYGHEYKYAAILIGAGLKTYADFPGLKLEEQRVGEAIDLTRGLGWDYYTDFFKGYVDEVRIWDGARTGDEIRGALRARFTEADVQQNRLAFYDLWTQYGSRYSAEAQATHVAAELRYHFAFDSVFGGTEPASLAKAPTGYLKTRAGIWSRPEDWACGWWKNVLDVYGSVYNDPRWIVWAPNTLSHLPNLDGTTRDSLYWSKDFEGGVGGSYGFALTAEPYSRWTQMIRNLSTADNSYRSTATRHQLVNTPEFLEGQPGFSKMQEFIGRTATQFGSDLLILGGAYAKSTDATVGLWDEDGASTNWEISGNDSDGNGLPDWWQTYADQNFRCEETSDVIDWTSIVEINGVKMTAGEAYLRDLASGVHVEGGEYVKSADYAQTSDMYASGIPDWWNNLYGLRGVSGLADSDNDGLPNYVEYLLSEVFALDGLRFSPIKANSIDVNTPDYFIPIGKLYAGEIFTDHDQVDDTWEDLYDASFASRLKFDAFKDADEDGWCNRSEVRYSKMCMPIVADQQSHYAAGEGASGSDGLVADYPIPTIELKVRYNGLRAEEVKSAAINVEVRSDESFVGSPDATYNVASVATTTGATGQDSTKDKKNDSAARTRNLGKWSNRHVVGTLTPGNISANSLALEMCYDPSSLVYTWVNQSESSSSGGMCRGSRAEYDAARRKYGSANISLISAETEYRALLDLELRTDESTGYATWLHTKSGREVGSVNMMTGAFDLDLGVFAGQYVVNASNEEEVVSLEDQNYRIVYNANPSVGLPRTLYLGEATSGHIREGKNTIVAWADLEGGAEGVWDVGEPFGIIRDVDISWRGTKVEMEITDMNAVFDRVQVGADGNSASSRQVFYGNEGGTGDNPNVSSNVQAKTLIDPTLNGGLINHVRVVPYLVRGTMQEKATNPEYKHDVPLYQCVTNRVVAEFDINAEGGNMIHEGHFVKAGSYDIDWDGFYEEIRYNQHVMDAVEDVTAVTYRLVLGETGEIGPQYAVDANTLVHALPTVVERRFETTENRTAPVMVSPGAVTEEQVVTASPTFTWRLDEPTEVSGRFGCSYTAFRLVIRKSSSVIYDSGYQRTPPRNSDGSFSWQPPICVGDKLTNGRVFENKASYTWNVSMYNSKFRDDLYGASSGSFFMNVQENGYSLGSIPVAVRYFGPSATRGVVRVQAFESPDFSGRPAGAGYVADPATMPLIGQAVKANATIIGLAKGTYYLLAFIDTNGNGKCDRWETSGYLCARDGSKEDGLNPVGYVFGDKLGKGDLAVIYLEDADTDGDGLPDAWEYATYGSLTAKGVGTLEPTPAGEFTVNTAVMANLTKQAGALAPTAGLAGRIGNTLSALASPTGISLVTGIDPADVVPTANGLEVKSEVDPETLTIVGLNVDAAAKLVTLKVGAETTANVDSAVAGIFNIKVAKGAEVTIKVEKAETPAGPWKVLPGVGGTVTVDRAGTDIKVELDGELPAQGYFRARIEE